MRNYLMHMKLRLAVDRNMHFAGATLIVLATLQWMPFVAKAESPESPESPGLVPQEVSRMVESYIDEPSLRAHTRFLADDLLEGRGPGSRGDRITQRYLATEFESHGFSPAGEEAGWYQRVPLVGVRTYPPEQIHFRKGDRSLSLIRHEQFVFTSGTPRQEVGFEDAELVFVGYGIQAPEYAWDDYKGADLRGKVLLMMNNDPADDPELFAGKRRLYYGRWDYKYLAAARQGAVGAILIHTDESAGYPFQVVQTSWSGEEFELAQQDLPQMELRGWMTEAASRDLVRFAGYDLDELRALAESRDFRPLPLDTRLSLKMKCDVRQQETGNVLARMEGSDPRLRHEVVVFMAHHDHLGMAAERDETGDHIYNGAVDNASGTAALLAIAEACGALAKAGQRPRRSVLFAAVGAEEQGLLGSQYFAEHPTIPPGRMAAVINIDGVNILGRSFDVNVIGLGKSSLDGVVRRVAESQRRTVVPDLFPDRGYYYRSDQFSLAKIGVPGVYLHGGVEIEGQPEGWGRQQKEDWIRSAYHQPSDEYRDDWDLRGAVEDVRLLFYTGWLVANQEAMPQWMPGDEFEAARREALQEVGDR